MAAIPVECWPTARNSTAGVEKLLAENASLRLSLNSLMGIPSFANDGEFHDGSLMQRCSRALQASVLVRQRHAELIQRNATVRRACAETLDAIKNLGMLTAVSQLTGES